MAAANDGGYVARSFDPQDGAVGKVRMFMTLDSDVRAALLKDHSSRRGRAWRQRAHKGHSPGCALFVPGPKKGTAWAHKGNIPGLKRAVPFVCPGLKRACAWGA